jgi:hypothetical protein
MIVVTDSTIIITMPGVDSSGPIMVRHTYSVQSGKLKKKNGVIKAKKTPAVYVPEKFEFEGDNLMRGTK